MSDNLPPSQSPPPTASMIHRVVASSLRQRFLIILMTLVLTGAGTWSLDRLSVDAYPDLSPPMVEIITQWPGHAAEEVERLITVPGGSGNERHPEDDDAAFDFAVRPVRRHPDAFATARTITSPANGSSTAFLISACRTA